jgi:hypothetical protein
MFNVTGLLNALAVFIRKRPGFDSLNYDTPARLAADVYVATRDLRDAEEMLRVLQRSSVPFDAPRIEAIIETSHRLNWTEADGIDFTPSQYWPMEYRAAACRTLARILTAHYGPSAREMVRPVVARRWFPKKGAPAP